MKKTNEPVELTDEEIGKVNGGFKIVLLDRPKFLDPLLRLIFKVKKHPDNGTNTTTNTDTVITGPIIADDDTD